MVPQRDQPAPGRTTTSGQRRAAATGRRPSTTTSVDGSGACSSGGTVGSAAGFSVIGCTSGALTLTRRRAHGQARNRATNRRCAGVSTARWR